MHHKPLFIGLDIGTSRAKAVLLTSEGQVIGRSKFPYSQLVTSSEGIEQNAEEWWTATRSLIRDLSKQVPDGYEISALCFSTQGGSLVLTDHEGKPLSPAVIWQDQRGLPYRDMLLQEVSAEAVHAKTGWSLGKGLNLLQIIRIRETDPSTFEKAAYFLSVPDFLALRLTGRPAVDCSNAGINQLMDVRRQAWDEDLLRAARIQSSQLPDIVPSGEIVGTLLPDVARDLNLNASVQLVSGGHDQYCAALGAGVIHEGDRLIGTGTAWVMLAASHELKTHPKDRKAFSRHTVKDLWGHMVSLGSGGYSLEWIRSALAIRGDQSFSLMSFQEMDQIVSKRISDANRPYYHPYLTGCPYPPNSEKAMASFTRLAPYHDRFDMVASVMEGVAMQVSWMWEAFADITPPTRPVIMTGGASSSKIWRQILADCLNQPIVVPSEPEIGCLGAAMLAGIGTGTFKDSEEAVSQMTEPVQTVLPDDRTEMMQERFNEFKRIQEKLR